MIMMFKCPLYAFLPKEKVRGVMLTPSFFSLMLIMPNSSILEINLMLYFMLNFPNKSDILSKCNDTNIWQSWRTFLIQAQTETQTTVYYDLIVTKQDDADSTALDLHIH